MAAHRSPAFRGRSSERELLDRLLDNVRGGQSAVLVLRGAAGVGKTALLHYCARPASCIRVARNGGVAPIGGAEAERELPSAGLQQLCAPILERPGLPPSPRQAARRGALQLPSG